MKEITDERILLIFDKYAELSSCECGRYGDNMYLDEESIINFARELLETVKED